MQQKRIIAIIVVIIALIAAVFAVNHFMNIPRTTITEYRNHNFSFAFPSNYEIKEYGNYAVGVGSPTPDGFDTAVTVKTVELDATAAPRTEDAFYAEQVKLLCEADVADETLSCDPAEPATYFNKQGLAVREYSLVLNRNNVTTGSVTTAPFGPVYVFPITPEEGSTYSAVVVFSPVSALSQGTPIADLAKSIVESLEFRTWLPAA